MNCSHSPPGLKDPPEQNYSKSSSTSSLPSSVSKRKRNNNLAPGSKEIRLTAKQAQQNRVNNKKIKDRKKEATKEATRMYTAERNNNLTESSKKAKGADNIVKEVKKNTIQL